MNTIRAWIRCVSVCRRARWITRANVAAASSLCLALHVQAAGLDVRVSGLAEPTGRVGCALFSGPAGFPLDNRAA